MTEPRDIDLENMSGAIALNAATSEEEVAFLAYLDGAEQTRYELTELRDTAVQLGLAVEPVQPPAELGQRILDLIAVTPQLGAETEAPVRHLVPRRRRRVVTRSLIAGLALVAAAVVGVVAVQVTAHPESTYQQIAEAPDMQQSTATVANGGTVAAAWSDKMGVSAVRLDGVAAAGEGKTYELWYVAADGTAKAAGLVPTHAGDWVMLTGPMQSGSAIAITVEPSGGSKQPTSTPVAVIPTA